MSSPNLEILKQIINFSEIISKDQKEFLLSNLENFSPIEVLKLKHVLISKNQSETGLIYEDLSKKFIAQNHKNSEDHPIKENVEVSLKKDEKTEDPHAKEGNVLSHSFLSDSNYLGQNPPKAPVNPNNPLDKIQEIEDLTQLAQLTPEHINFRINDSIDQIVNDFFKKTEKMFSKLESLDQRRSFFMSFIQSSLFASYLNTGLTALRHPEIKPRQTVLNTLHKTNSQYLSKKQFQYASLISHHLRKLAAL